MSDFSRLLWRGPRLGVALGVSFTAVLTLLFLFQAHARAAHIITGAFNCGTFADGVAYTPEGRTMAPMVPPRDSDSPVITKSLAIIGGWTRLDFSNCPPENQNENNNALVTGTQGLLDAGFDYVAPITRSELNSSGGSIALFDLTNKEVLIEHMIWADNNGQSTDPGAGVWAEVKAGSAVRINNTLFEFNETDNGTTDSGGGLYLYLNDNATVTIEDSQFDQNRSGRGGGLYAEVRQNSHLLIERTQFTQNGGYSGGGLYLYVDATSQVTLREVVFSQNDNQLVNNNGGAIYLVVEEGGRVNILDSTFDSNNAGEKGGAIYAELNGGDLFIGRSHFLNNDASDLGSAIYVENNSAEHAALTLFGNHFENNGPANYINQVANGAGQMEVRELDSVAYLPLTASNYNPSAPRATITGITRQPDYSYSVDFETENFTPQLPGTHLHFFFNTVSPENAGMPGRPWKIYGGSKSVYRVFVCGEAVWLAGGDPSRVLVANPTHSVMLNSGNCYELPEG